MFRGKNAVVPLAWLGALGLMGSLVAQTKSPAIGRELRPMRLWGLVSARLLGHVNRDDAKAALKVWFDVLAEQRGFVLDSRVDIVDTSAEVRRRLENQSADIAILAVTDYLELESSHLMMPILTDARGPMSSPQYSYLLLTRGSAGASSLAELRGKSVLVAGRSVQKTGLMWLEVLVNKEKLGPAGVLFGSLKLTDTAQSCVLQLFFGKVDACVEDEISFNLAKELNPQLNQLKVIARSRPLIESVMVMPLKPNPFHQELMDTMLMLHNYSRGRQLLMVFKTDRLVPVQAADFDSFREIWRDYEHLPDAAQRRSVTSPREVEKH